VSLSIEGLNFTYGQGAFTLKVPRLHIDPGQGVALVGPSGSGKTTLLNLVAGILQPDTGTVFLRDEDLGALGAARRREHRLRQMGMVFQSFELLEYLDVRDNVLLQARLAPGVRVDAGLEQRGRDIADALGLGDKWRRPVTASTRRQRLDRSRCRALVHPRGCRDSRERHRRRRCAPFRPCACRSSLPGLRVRSSWSPRPRVARLART